MTDLRALDDAFGELERRADAATADRPLDLPSRTRGTSRTRLVLAGAAVVVVAGLAATTTLLVPGDNTTTQVAAPPEAVSTTLPTTTSQARPAVPRSPEELAERLRAVLGDTATFTVTETGPGAVIMSLPPAPPAGSQAPPAGSQAPPPADDGSSHAGTPVGASIVGTLTAGGVTGGFDLLMYPGDNPDRRPGCDNPEPPACTVRQLPDGSWLAAGESTLEGSANGKTYMVNLVRPDGTVFVMHVSNQRSPKGASEELAPQPPLTLDRLIEIATSDRW